MMDTATHLAIQAVVRALFRRRIIDEDEIAEIMNELEEAAEMQRRGGRPEGEQALMRLAANIGRDANIGE